MTWTPIWRALKWSWDTTEYWVLGSIWSQRRAGVLHWEIIQGLSKPPKARPKLTLGVFFPFSCCLRTPLDWPTAGQGLPGEASTSSVSWTYLLKTYLSHLVKYRTLGLTSDLLTWSLLTRVFWKLNFCKHPKWFLGKDKFGELGKDCCFIFPMALVLWVGKEVWKVCRPRLLKTDVVSVSGALMNQTFSWLSSFYCLEMYQMIMPLGMGCVWSVCVNAGLILHFSLL